MVLKNSQEPLYVCLIDMQIKICCFVFIQDQNQPQDMKSL